MMKFTHRRSEGSVLASYISDFATVPVLRLLGVSTLLTNLANVVLMSFMGMWLYEYLARPEPRDELSHAEVIPLLVVIVSLAVSLLMSGFVVFALVADLSSSQGPRVAPSACRFGFYAVSSAALLTLSAVPAGLGFTAVCVWALGVTSAGGLVTTIIAITWPLVTLTFFLFAAALLVASCRDAEVRESKV